MRSTYIITPLKATSQFNIKELNIKGAIELGFDSESMSDLIRHKCAMDQGFVRRFRLERDNISVNFSDDFSMPVKDVQLSVFENGIGLLSVLFIINEEEIDRIYNFINPGYLDDKDKELQQYFINDIRDKVLSGTGFDIDVEGDDKKLAIKESYLFNAAFTDCRYKELEQIDKATFNVHKLIKVDEEFDDRSERDIAYTYGARDVENKTYRWGACISSQSISFVYGPSNSNYDFENKIAYKSSKDFSVEDMSLLMEDDLLLTILALHQRFTCADFSERVFNGIYNEGIGNIKKLKEEMLEFKAFGTITPFQVSRWHNVCETYRYLLKMNGVDEALVDIGEKINLLDEEMEQNTDRKRNIFATIIAIFGLTSIIASVQQITDYIMQGDPTIEMWTGISVGGIVLLGIAFIIALRRK